MVALCIDSSVGIEVLYVVVLSILLSSQRPWVKAVSYCMHMCVCVCEREKEQNLIFAMISLLDASRKILQAINLVNLAWYALLIQNCFFVIYYACHLQEKY